MLNFCSLYSGSSGNSLLVETENTKLLVDAGVSSRKIENALNDINIDPSSIDAILITHEHSDHVQGLGTFSKKFDLPVFVNQETLDAMPKQRDKIADKNINKFNLKDTFDIGIITILFDVSIGSPIIVFTSIISCILFIAVVIRPSIGCSLIFITFPFFIYYTYCIYNMYHFYFKYT